MVACASLLAGVVVGGGGGQLVTGTLIPTPYCAGSEPAGASTPETRETREQLERAAGQGIVVRMEDRATPELVRAAGRGTIGGVVLFPPEGTAPAQLAIELAKLRRAALLGGVPAPIASIDQEGGIVKRLPALAPRTSPYEIGQGDDRSAARREGSATGADLAELGIDVNLAPVLDVPSSESQFMAPRAFGASREQVARLGVAFATAMQRRGVAATAKHFPGLGRAPLNTDFSPTSVAGSRAALRADLRPFVHAIDAGVRLVMVSSAVYPSLGSDMPAVLSPEIATGLLRDRLGFRGVSISDDLLAPALGYQGPGAAAQAGIAAKSAGMDLLLFARRDVGNVAAALARAARADRLDAQVLVDSCERIVELKGQVAATARP